MTIAAAAEAARGAQPLWSLVPVSARAQYIRRAAVAMLDELDDLALLFADQTGRPRSQIVRSELLPAARGLRALADDGPRALADRRLSPWFSGRRTRLVQAPVGVIGLRGPSASPLAEPALETAAALLAGNGVLLDVPAQRLRNVFLRAGVPGELVVPVSGDLGGVCRRVVDLPRPDRRGTLLVLSGAPQTRLVEAAMAAAFAGGQGAGRIVAVAAPGLVQALAARAETLRVGDPRDPDTEVAGPPEVIGPVTGDDPRFLSPPPGPVLVVAEVPDNESAIALVAREARDAPISIWAQDHAKGERVARRLPSPSTWIGRHGEASTAVDVRIARHVVARQLESRPQWLPDTVLSVDAMTALAEVRYGRESRRWPALRALVRTARRER